MPQRWIAHEYGGPEKLSFETFQHADAQPGDVVIAVKAAGMNPIDAKRLAGVGGLPPLEALTFGFEIAGVITAIADGTRIQTGVAQVGDPVVAFQITNGYSTEVVTSATNVFAKPPQLSFPEAANLLLVGTTASELLHRAGVTAGDVVLVHGGSGAVGNSLVQQAKLLGARVIATSGPAGFERLSAYGAEPVRYGPGLADRLTGLAPDGYDVALDTVGSDEAIQTSLALVSDRKRIVTTVARAAAETYGLVYIGGGVPGTAEYRASVRGDVLDLARSGALAVHVSQTFAMSDAPEALALLSGGHPGGKLALVV
jgi:NADPH2:quinone reductase